jgi:hypothetical protein
MLLASATPEIGSKRSGYSVRACRLRSSSTSSRTPRHPRLLQ